MKDTFVTWMEGRLKGDASKTMSAVSYKPLPTDKSGNVHYSSRTCPCLSRTKITALIIIVSLASVLVFLTCFNSGWLHYSNVCSTVSHDGIGSDFKMGKIRYKHTKRRLPHCIIIGVRKGGTRALLQYMKLHPDIQTAPEEIHYFDDNVNYSKGLDWYRKQMPFSFKDQLTMEKTPAYFVEEKVPGRLFLMNSLIKLILIVREPIDRAISDYTQIYIGKKQQGKPFPRFEDLAIDPETGEVNTSYKAIKRSIYHRHLKRWLKFFSLSQIHIVDGENLVKNPYDEVYKVEDFLGVGHRIQKENFYFNQTRGFYCINRPEKGRKCLAKSKGRKHPYVDPEVMETLKNFFKLHNEKFFHMIKRRFDW